MTEAVKELLDAFDALPVEEQREAAAELLRRILKGEAGDIPEGGLLAAAEALFLDLDAREAADG